MLECSLDDDVPTDFGMIPLNQHTFNFILEDDVTASSGISFKDSEQKQDGLQVGESVVDHSTLSSDKSGDPQVSKSQHTP